MIIGTILLTKDNKYTCGEDTLPQRRKHDKNLLTKLAKGKTVSLEGWEMLPPSIKTKVFITDEEPTFPVTVPEIEGLTDLLLVSHSDQKECEGKTFRLDSFDLIVEGENVSIYVRKENT